MPEFVRRRLALGRCRNLAIDDDAGPRSWLVEVRPEQPRHRPPHEQDVRRIKSGVDVNVAAPVYAQVTMRLRGGEVRDPVGSCPRPQLPTAAGAAAPAAGRAVGRADPRSGRITSGSGWQYYPNSPAGWAACDKDGANGEYWGLWPD